MKKLIVIFLGTLFAFTVSAQKLIDLYKNGSVKLVPDTEYGKDQKNFSVTFNDSLYGKRVGNLNCITLMPDGSMVVARPNRNVYLMFTPTGYFDKELGIKNSKGVLLKETNEIQGVVNNNTFYTSPDNMGNLICFDFNGNFVKTLKLDYSTRQMITLPNNKIAVVGWVIWKEKIREFVSIVNYQTNEEKVVWEHFTDRSCEPGKECKLFNYSYAFKKGGMFSISTMPFANATGMSSPPIIATTGNQLVVAIPSTGEINLFDLNGTKEGVQKVSWANNFISVDEQKEIQRKAIEHYKNIKNPFYSSTISPEENKVENEIALKTIVNEMEQDLQKITEPIPVPAISTIIKDSDGNLLFFEYPKEENANKFNVWIMQNGGQFVCQSSFVCDEYDLKINPAKMVFYNGMIYGLQKLKKAERNPLRLVRFKLE